MEKFPRVRFQNEEFILVGDKDDCAITTKYLYENCLTSYAHLFPDGNIKRLNVVIGTKKDLLYLDKKNSVD